MHDRNQALRILVAAALVGCGAGLASSVFLESLAFVTDFRGDHPWLLLLLPLAGAAIAWLYAGHGRSASGGTNLILDEIHAPGGAGVPLRMLPLILGTTLITHLFGGSAGREGTAVQMGGSIAAEIARRLRLDSDSSRLLLMCGISGGFSGVFGTPLAATIFGLEVLALGGLRYSALIPCLVSAIAADQTIQFLKIEHANYQMANLAPTIDLSSIVQVAIAGIAFGLASALFIELTGAIERASRRIFANPMLRTASGGALIVLLTLALGTRDYYGLSLPLIERSLSGAEVPALAFLIKLGLTALTLGVGFKGGEVTPLFVIGATLGATLASPLSLSVELLAALGFVSVFAAAANTPLACLVMAVELFGGQSGLLFGLAVFVAYFISGHRGIYGSQRVIAGKRGQDYAAGDVVLRDMRRPIR